MKENNIFLLCPLLLPVLMIGVGLIYIFKKDWTWKFAENMMKTVKPQRTPEWEKGVTVNGVILIIAGVIFLSLILFAL